MDSFSGFFFDIDISPRPTKSGNFYKVEIHRSGFYAWCTLRKHD
ncbi:hypothetical protein THARTR1_01844 [Trichoderma harzianum]|uniref:Uncharacterized protein n=1 Tax=Trichoderma harzianum TaxID=5544 RepID=A0A2K0UKL1_TRIHA|nr:hypothetical protein THARTR1_01844 [Trichoderma harzianum]